MNYRPTILLLFCLLLLSCEQKPHLSNSRTPEQSNTTTQSRATIKDSVQSIVQEYPPPADEDWCTGPEWNTDSLFRRIKYPGGKIDIEGKVVIQVLVDTNGRASKTRIIESVNRLFNQPVIDAVEQTHFTPAYRLDNHRPVAVWITIPIELQQI